MKLIIVRHGQTVENTLGITQGQIDGKLTELGISQAKKLALRLKDEKINHIYSSDLKRASLTAKEIGVYHTDVPFTLVKELREATRGKFDGKHRDIVHKHLMEHVIPKGIAFEDYLWPEGESFAQMKKRTIDFVASLFEKHKGQTILLVTHGGNILHMVMHYEKVPITQSNLKKYQPLNCSVTEIEFSDDKSHKLIKRNCVLHLE